MIRVKTILGKIFSAKLSDQQLFATAFETFLPSKVTCPKCKAVGLCVSHSAYPRHMISMEDGVRTQITISVPRVLCTSCGRTHAILPDVLIPFGSYTLRFILTILEGYPSRAGSVALFCEHWQISISTLYGWLHLFEEQASLWFGILETIQHRWQDALPKLCEIHSFPSRFFEAHRFSFLQFHKVSRSGPAYASP